MKRITRQDIDGALSTVGVKAGQILYLYTDLSSPGPIEGIRDREAFCDTYFGTIMDTLGDEGTLVVPTYTSQVARDDIEFVWEETPSVIGMFPEFVRRHPDSLRSLHPIHSLTAIGARKTDICSGNGVSDFGWNSPFHRLLELDAQILTIGLEPAFVVAIANLIEAFCCVPYQYNKLLKWRPIVEGRKLDRQYVSVARYLHLGAYHDLSRFAAHVDEMGLITSAPLGASVVRMTRVREVFEAGVDFLAEHPYGFLMEEPEFEFGTLPYDGPTRGRDGIS